MKLIIKIPNNPIIEQPLMMPPIPSGSENKERITSLVVFSMNNVLLSEGDFDVSLVNNKDEVILFSRTNVVTRIKTGEKPVKN